MGAQTIMSINTYIPEWVQHPQARKDAFYAMCNPVWDKKFVIIPKTCYLSGKRIWFEYAYTSTAIVDNIRLESWHNQVEHVMWILQGRPRE